MASVSLLPASRTRYHSTASSHSTHVPSSPKRAKAMSSPRSPSPLPQKLPAAMSPPVSADSGRGDRLNSPLRASIASSSGSHGFGRSGGQKARMGSHPPRPKLDDKRAVAYDRMSARQSPYCSPPSGGMSRSGRLTGISSGGSSKDGQTARRRELSVPLLSQTLSHFSLGQTSPTNEPESSGPSSRVALSSPGGRGPVRTSASTTRYHYRMPSFSSPPPLPRNHPYPATDSLVQGPTFLGSPFSSEKRRGKFVYSHARTPSRAHEIVAPTSRMEIDPAELAEDWADRSEWMVDTSLDTLDIDLEASPTAFCPSSQMAQRRRQQRPRRGTSNSASSFDGFSTSGASSNSLRSLARTSTDSQAPKAVQIFGEGAFGHEPSTPSHHFFASHNLSSARAGDSSRPIRLGEFALPERDSPGMSPLLRKSTKQTSTKTPPQARLQTSRSSAPASNRVERGAPVAPTTKKRSPFSSLIPRLMSSRSAKPSMRSSAPPPHSPSAIFSGTPWCEPDENEWTGQGAQALGFMPDPAGDTSSNPFGKSFSSESSLDMQYSPLKPLSAKPSNRMLPVALPFASVPSEARASKIAANRRNPAINIPGSGPKVHAKLAVTSTPSLKDPVASKNGRPFLRRGITEPGQPRPTIHATLIGAEKLATHTPPPPASAIFGDIIPSPTAFASTGLIKKRAAISGDIPVFGAADPSIDSPTPAGIASDSAAIAVPGLPAAIAAARQARSGLRHVSHASSTSIGSASTYCDASSYKSRGLRRKGSQFFAAGSSASIGEMPAGWAASPSTPTKPAGVQLSFSPFALSAPTPPPKTPVTVRYPFAMSSPAAGPTTPSPKLFSTVQPTQTAVPTPPPGSLHSRIRSLSGRGPVARASNPMLAASYRAAADSPPTAPVQPIVTKRAFPSSNRGLRLPNRDLEMVAPLGSGSFSQVWKVKDNKGKLFAVKAGKPYTGTKNRLRQLEEVSILHTLSLNPHPHIIAFVDSWEHSRRLYLQTELLVYGDLAKFLSALGDSAGLGEARVWKTLSELSSALQHVHSFKLLHLDLKPSNVLITSEGALKIGDFGMSVVSDEQGMVEDHLSPALPDVADGGEFVWDNVDSLQEEDEEATGRTSTDSSASDSGPRRGTSVMKVIASPHLDRDVEGDREYLSPESLDGKIGRPADVFSMGILLLEAALNVVLPSNGEAWVKLRSDDFSDIEDHYVLRDEHAKEDPSEAESLPVLSAELINTIKGLMRASPLERTTLAEVRETKVVRRLRDGSVPCKGPALVAEDEEWLTSALA